MVFRSVRVGRCCQALYVLIALCLSSPLWAISQSPHCVVGSLKHINLSGYRDGLADEMRTIKCISSCSVKYEYWRYVETCPYLPNGDVDIYNCAAQADFSVLSKDTHNCAGYIIDSSMPDSGSLDNNPYEDQLNDSGFQPPDTQGQSNMPPALLIDPHVATLQSCSGNDCSSAINTNIKSQIFQNDVIQKNMIRSQQANEKFYAENLKFLDTVQHWAQATALAVTSLNQRTAAVAKDQLWYSTMINNSLNGIEQRTNESHGTLHSILGLQQMIGQAAVAMNPNVEDIRNETRTHTTILNSQSNKLSGVEFNTNKIRLNSWSIRTDAKKILAEAKVTNSELAELVSDNQDIKGSLSDLVTSNNQIVEGLDNISFTGDVNVDNSDVIAAITQGNADIVEAINNITISSATGTQNTIDASSCAAFSCSGDAHSCFMARRMWEADCAADEIDGLPAAGAFGTMTGNVEAKLEEIADVKSDLEAVYEEYSVINLFGKYADGEGLDYQASCPDPDVIDVLNGEVHVSYSALCESAGLHKALFISFAFLSAVGMFVKYM
ncbi:hypothetical protein [Thaumasiovibrio subtropicus]|uniref:hypothetical protein n=1 Tax=Thaumasiovibrio subtropicus TaxID=1891207 RepID=UPI000B34C06C|nr:hypothetical protein [Thaumasiovibrio subtropicus]